MRARRTLSNVAEHVAVAMARELTADNKVSAPSKSPHSNGAEKGVIMRGDKVVYIPGSAPDLEYLESKYGQIESVNRYEEGDSPGVVKVVIMNFND